MLNLITNILIGIIAALHIYFLVLEMFLWQTPYGLKTFQMNFVKARDTAVLAANQGLYNGFLAAGLIMSLLSSKPEVRSAFQLFFLDCIILAGLYGGLTVNKKIFYIQALPAVIALILVLFLLQL
jgi:putative membrane protein